MKETEKQCSYLKGDRVKQKFFRKYFYFLQESVLSQDVLRQFFVKEKNQCIVKKQFVISAFNPPDDDPTINSVFVHLQPVWP